MQEIVKTPLAPIPARIVEITPETPDTKTFVFEVEGRLAEAPKPGQFTEIYVPGVGEAPVSICECLGDGRIAQTVRSVGVLTDYLFKLKEGDRIGIRGPYGKGWPLDRLEGKDVLIVAGGIGLAPLRGVIRELEKNRGKYGKLTLLYGARTPSLLLYRYEYDRYRAIPNSEFLLTVDHADETWKGNVGVVTQLIPKARIDVEKTIALICGPEIMMRFTIKALSEIGFKDNQIYLSLERRMKCGVGLCGHCQLGPYFVCKHGPVFPYWLIKRYFWVDEI
ncbi:MAG: Ni/Fe hydrogenase subunit gamma [Thaumarchaeota archaeon]|nr:MAG: Ni/Fe hydrogenase subunit gamma [Nitrososphaerota archaeon]